MLCGGFECVLQPFILLEFLDLIDPMKLKWILCCCKSLVVCSSGSPSSVERDMTVCVSPLFGAHCSS